jgi:hypothetical protein
MYYKETAQFAHSILGKLVAIALILLYTRVDILYGAFVCALVIFYYQTDYVEGFDYSEVDMTDAMPYIGETRNDVQKVFTKNNCENGKLKYKSMEVKSEMAPHVFTELNYTDRPCNPCSDSCGFSIVEEKIQK